MWNNQMLSYTDNILKGSYHELIIIHTQITHQVSRRVRKTRTPLLMLFIFYKTSKLILEWWKWMTINLYSVWKLVFRLLTKDKNDGYIAKTGRTGFKMRKPEYYEILFWFSKYSLWKIVDIIMQPRKTWIHILTSFLKQTQNV